MVLEALKMIYGVDILQNVIFKVNKKITKHNVFVHSVR